MNYKCCARLMSIAKFAIQSTRYDRTILYTCNSRQTFSQIPHESNRQSYSLLLISHNTHSCALRSIPGTIRQSCAPKLHNSASSLESPLIALNRFKQSAANSLFADRSDISVRTEIHKALCGLRVIGHYPGTVANQPHLSTDQSVCTFAGSSRYMSWPNRVTNTRLNVTYTFDNDLQM